MESNMTEPSYFRGYHAIKEVVDYMRPLAEWMEMHKPGVKEITLKRGDYDLLKRWPRAAGMHNVTVTADGVTYKGFALKHDRKPPRYDK